MFVLHPQLETDTHPVGNLPLCRVLLMNNALYPWVILVPQHNNLTEITDLSAPQRAQLMEETATVASTMKQIYWPEKMNIAALGNQVPQLHVHIIARFKTDQAWPNPVWGQGSKPYSPSGRDQTIEVLRARLREVNTIEV